MKINKKEKILILVLVFVLIVGIFLMYGIIPKSKELKEKQAECDKLQLEVNELIRKYNINDPVKKVSNIEDLLMSYYLKDSDAYIFVNDGDDSNEAKLGILFDFKPLFDGVVESLTINGYNAKKSNEITESSIREENFDFKPTLVEQKVYSLYYVSGTINFYVNNIDEVSDIIDKIGESIEYQMRDFSLTVDVKADYKYSGNIVISKYYIGTPDYIPLPLSDDFDLNSNINDAPPVPFINVDTKKLTFDIIPNASYYEIYEVISTVDEFGTKTFEKFSDRPLVSGLKPNENENFVEFGYEGKLSPDKQYVFTAVGNYKDYLFKDAPKGEKVYYRTILSEPLAIDRQFSVN